MKKMQLMLLAVILCMSFACSAKNVNTDNAAMQHDTHNVQSSDKDVSSGMHNAAGHNMAEGHDMSKMDGMCDMKHMDGHDKRDMKCMQNMCDMGSMKCGSDMKCAKDAQKCDPLPSWNDKQVKKNIIAYIAKITDKSSESYIPKEDRIATFDNDGTLWAERPIIQLIYVQEKVKEKAEKDASLKDKEPYKSLMNGDLEALMKMDPKVVMSAMMEMQTGMTVEEYEKDVENFFNTVKYPKPAVSLDKVIYKPQLELVKYLKKNGFKVYICSGGDTDLMRVISEKYYGIPKENVIGSFFDYKYDDEKNVVIREPKFVTNNDKEVKPVSIAAKIGKIPVFTCGNVGNDGDVFMLHYSQSSKYASFQLMINHDDAKREFAYKDKTSLEKSKKYNWNVVNMKSDWKEIF